MFEAFARVRLIEEGSREFLWALGLGSFSSCCGARPLGCLFVHGTECALGICGLGPSDFRVDVDCCAGVQIQFGLRGSEFSMNQRLNEGLGVRPLGFRFGVWASLGWGSLGLGAIGRAS